MVIANNFGNEDYWRACRDSPTEGEFVDDSRGTWPGLRRLIAAVGLSMDECYLINAYVGLLPDNTVITSNLPGARDPGYRSACECSLRSQFEVVRPGVVMVLGVSAINMFGRMVPSLCHWVGPNRGKKTFAEIDDSNAGFVRQAEISDQGLVVNVVALTHPSHQNQRLRRFSCDARLLRGIQAEHAMIERALQ